VYDEEAPNVDSKRVCSGARRKWPGAFVQVHDAHHVASEEQLGLQHLVRCHEDPLVIHAKASLIHESSTMEIIASIEWLQVDGGLENRANYYECKTL
jgi:hypothetical protein